MAKELPFISHCLHPTAKETRKCSMSPGHVVQGLDDKEDEKNGYWADMGSICH
jgi:hypothetical protein